PRRPSQLSGRQWWGVVRRTVVEFIADELTDRAAALTYYSIMSIFPGLLVLVAGVGLFGRSTTNAVVINLGQLAPGPARQLVTTAIENLRASQHTAGVIAAVGLALAFWSASGYIGGFIRAANTIYDVPEGRPMWKIVPIQLVVTAVTGVFLAASALAVVLTGRLAQQVGRALSVEEQTVRLFDIVKWPVLVVAVALLIALLYWVAPNARQGGFRWITPGSALAVLAWLIVSAGFAVYLAYFDTYNRTYGSLGAVIVFLVWLWLTNVSVLLGAEFDAELGRARALAAGLPQHAEPYLPMRDLPRERDEPTEAVASGERAQPRAPEEPTDASATRG
ncbi:MAG TPA: YihY/virulence factor BrkB family protein, partial [Micromonosporaceae bacterium]